MSRSQTNVRNTCPHKKLRTTFISLERKHASSEIHARGVGNTNCQHCLVTNGFNGNSHKELYTREEVGAVTPNMLNIYDPASVFISFLFSDAPRKRRAASEGLLDICDVGTVGLYPDGQHCQAKRSTKLSLPSLLTWSEKKKTKKVVPQLFRVVALKKIQYMKKNIPELLSEFPPFTKEEINQSSNLRNAGVRNFSHTQIGVKYLVLLPKYFKCCITN